LFHAAQFILLSEGAAQDGVDQAAGSFGKRHVFIDGSVGSGLQDEQFRECHAQAPAGVFIQLAGAEMFNPEIQQAEVPEGGEYQGEQQVVVFALNPVLLAAARQQFAGMGKLRLPLAEDLQGQ
jgi:hypothetical protein